MDLDLAFAFLIFWRAIGNWHLLNPIPGDDNDDLDDDHDDDELIRIWWFVCVVGGGGDGVCGVVVVVVMVFKKRLLFKILDCKTRATAVMNIVCI